MKLSSSAICSFFSSSLTASAAGPSKSSSNSLSSASCLFSPPSNELLPKPRISNVPDEDRPDRPDRPETLMPESATPPTPLAPMMAAAIFRNSSSSFSTSA